MWQIGMGRSWLYRWQCYIIINCKGKEQPKQKMQHNKAYKNKIKTLCTIETSDIELHDGRPKTHTLIPAAKKSSNFSQSHVSANTATNKDKFVGSPCLGKTAGKGVGTPSRNSNQYFRNTFNGRNPIVASPTKSNHKSKSKSKSKSLLNYTVSKQKSRVKTEYSTSSDMVFKSILSKSSKTIKNALSNPLQQTYQIQTYQILEQLPVQSPTIPKSQKYYLARKSDKLYLMKKTKDTRIKELYENQMAVKGRLASCNVKWRNLEKLVKLYSQRNLLYGIYQYNGMYLSWDNQSHMQVIDKILKHDGVVLKHILKQIAKGINELSSKGYTHSRVKFQNITIKIHEQRKTIKVEGNVKLSNLYHSFQVKDKQKLLSFPDSIYTPPEIINLKLFNCKEKFDRDLIEYISYYDQPWYADVWGLGVLMLELIAGEAISIEKAGNTATTRNDLGLDSDSQGEQLLPMSNKNKTKTNEKCPQITLTDILEAQKSLLIQTETQIQKISFDKKLQNLLIRMLSVNPLSRPSPKQIIKDL